MTTGQKKFRVENFDDFQRELKSFFKSLIGLNDKGEFLGEIDEDLAIKKIEIANRRWSGTKLVLGKN